MTKIVRATSPEELKKLLKKVPSGTTILFDEPYNQQISILDGPYYDDFREWFQKSAYIGFGIEVALYRAFVAGREKQTMGQKR